MSRLGDLPASDHWFWKGARKFQKAFVKKPVCEHYFEYRNAREIACKNCNIGYYFSGKEYLKDGKIEIRA